MRHPRGRLTAEDLIDLNRRVLLETAFEGDRPHGVQNVAGLRRAAAASWDAYPEDPHKRATLLCCAIIANHPFNDGNHRTSLEAATLQLLMDGWFYTGTQEAEKIIYNWRFDHEEKNDLEATWSRVFGGWDVEGETRHLRELVESEYGREIELFLRTHTEKMPIDSILLWMPPAVYARQMRSYPPGAWKKEINRKRRAAASQLRPIWKHYERLLEDRPMRPRPPQKHWRPEKL